MLKLLVSDKYIFSSSSDNTCKLWRLEEEDEEEDIEVCLRTFEVSAVANISELSASAGGLEFTYTRLALCSETSS